MAGAFSGHLINAFEQNVPPSSICHNGLVSFDSSVHGINMFSTQQSLALNSASMSASQSSSASAFSESMFDRVNRLQAKLNQKLGPEYVSQRPGPAGAGKLTYAEGWKAITPSQLINVANEVFGYDGWSSSIVNITTDYMDYNEESRRYNCGVSVIMRVTLREGVAHEDVGFGTIDNAKSKGAALDKCKKEAVTDALKRTLRTFGNVLGNCLYDKQYAAEVTKMKVPPIKFDPDNLHRLPGLAINKAVSASSSTPIHAPPPVAPALRPQQQQQPPPPAPKREPLPKPIPQPKPLATSTPIDRKVSFAPQPPPPAIVKKEEPASIPAKTASFDEYDEYGFSDDDAFLSTVDLGEGDLGRPIDFEEGLSGGTALEEREQMEAAAAAVADRHGPMGIDKATSKPPIQRGNMGPPPPPQNNNSNRPTTSHITAQSAPAIPSTSSSTKPASVRAPPSMGGFHFPPGMEETILSQNRNPNQPPPHLSGGVKRNADTMIAGSAMSRPGMGLSNVRQPLGTIALDNSGDAKRQRR
ncbi:hypothetical protein MIND_00952200 [Mycena indigotica]|uniref:Uncharacterized protein n=1 Tax=Mycena indigotica TaxID=2126181 RepID=A0A8H6SED2_9AGAR|nr:uncharacterized protein MIND_00952200 [Mycena indigotica]KAF7297191.1 hypothetical protein MIND_00952200 [Mycena indigotica]